MSDSSNGEGHPAKNMKRWRFRQRWRFEGCLCTQTSLHIGSGQVTTRPDLESGDGEIDINAHTVDHTGCACIFGSTLKGCIRAWMDAVLSAPETSEEMTPESLRSYLMAFEKIMGKRAREDAEINDSLGGMAEFHDARIAAPRMEPTPLPHWSPLRQTWIETTNSIDRHTRTAADKHLIQTECVPAGVGFDIVITGMFEDEHQVAFLLSMLEGFNHPEHPILLGADTASGKGRMRWELGRLYTMAETDVLEWVKNPDRRMADADMKPLSSKSHQELLSKAASFELSPSQKQMLSIPITLNFTSHFLVNDPPSAREIENATVKEKNGKKKKMIPDHRPRVDEYGCVILPAHSFRGAFRNQAERILRTMGIETCEPAGKPEARFCAKIIDGGKNKENLCLACKIFGAPGWRSPIEISDFQLEPGDYECEVQEFVAIDRFTGGAKDEAKFNAQAIYKPVFTGMLRVDESRLPDTGLALLALTLRDLQEEDITFGYGAAKGYGTCKGVIPVMDEKDFQDRVKGSLDKLRTLAEKDKPNE